MYLIFYLLFLQNMAAVKVLDTDASSFNKKQKDFLSSPKVTCAKILREQVFAGHTDRSLKKWNMNTLECVDLIPELTNEITTLAVNKEYIIYAMADKSLNLWSFNGNPAIRSTLHSSPVSSLKLQNNIVVSFSEVIFFSLKLNKLKFF